MRDAAMRIAAPGGGGCAGSGPADESTSSVVLAAEDEAGFVSVIDPLPLCQFTVPHKTTHPGEYLMLCGSVPELGR